MGAGVLSASDCGMVFNVKDEIVFSSGGLELGGSLFPVSTIVGVGHLEDSQGNVITDKDTIKTQMVEWSAGGTVSAFGMTSKYYNSAGYVFVVEGLTENVGLGLGVSWTRYVGTKQEVAEG